MNEPVVLSESGAESLRATGPGDRLLRMVAAYDEYSTHSTVRYANGGRIAPVPYPGLRSFTPAEGNVFFGRDRSVDEIRQRLADRRMVVVLGGSGSGKSSVVRAGLVPRLNSVKGIPGRTGNWYSAEFRPRTAPISELVDALCSLVVTEFGDVLVGDESAGQATVDRKKLRKELRAKFLLDQNQHETGRGAELAKALVWFVKGKLDGLEQAASGHRRAGKPNLLLVVDQFEEVFRPEVARDGPGNAGDLLDLIVSLHRLLGQERRADGTNAQAHSGLFVAITMRSEELHRCTEHPGLVDVVNDGPFLLDLLDPKANEAELRDAILRPARRVFRDWGVPFDASPGSDAPFEPGTPKWLLDGASALAGDLNHRPDQLPLLQHALQAMWHNAISEWRQKTGAGIERPLIRRHHLAEAIATDAVSADLRACLDRQADRAAENARRAFVGDIRTGTSVPEAAAEAALKATFRALARRDDRGNWARRFARTEDIIAFLDVDPAAAGQPREKRHHGLSAALNTFRNAGYIGGEGTDERPWDISHEALIRNWNRCLLWLREPEIVAQALAYAVQDLGRVRSDQSGEAISERMPPGLADALRPALGVQPALPTKWTEEQLSMLLGRRDLSGRRVSQAKEPSGIVESAESVRELLTAALRRSDSARGRKQIYKTIIAAGAGLVVVVIAWFWGQVREREEAARAAGGQALLGHLFSDTGSRWDDGLRAATAKHVASMLDDPGYGKAPADEMKRWAHGSWDATVRQLLGRTYAIREHRQSAVRQNKRDAFGTLQEPAASGQQPKLYCLTVGFGRTTGDPPVIPATNGWQIGLRTMGSGAAGTKLILEARPNPQSAWQAVQGDADSLPPSLVEGAQVCLSADASVLTHAAVGWHQPEISNLMWTFGCGEGTQANCSGSIPYLAIQTMWWPRIVPSALAEEIVSYEARRESWWPCVQSVTTAGPSGRVSVQFQRQGRGCISPLEGTQAFEAEFYAGLVTPRRLAKMPESNNGGTCSAKDAKASPVPGRGTARALVSVTCEALSEEPGTGTKVTVEQQDAKVWRASIEEPRSKALTTVSIPLPFTEISRAFVAAKDGFVVEARGEYWQFAYGRHMLLSALQDRIDRIPPETRPVPREVKMFASEEELKALSVTGPQDITK
jgi:hypothetical protein